MNSTDTYAYLVRRISQLMATIGKDQAERLAFELTSAINSTMAGFHNPAERTEWRELLPESVRNAASLTCPWDAFNQAYNSQHSHHISRVELLCTMPASIRLSQEIREMSGGTGLWAGSLFQCICDIINEARSELCVMVPYWSVPGVQSLLRHVTRTTMKGLRVSIFTRSKGELKSSNQLEGLASLTTSLWAKDAVVEIYSPKSHEGYRPLVHAKMVIADKTTAYVGSANFSAGGIEHSIETGVKLEGSEVLILRDWVTAMGPAFEKWDLQDVLQ